MKKLSVVVLLIVVFSVTAVVASASVPALFYLASMDRNCQLPDASVRPQEIAESKIQMSEVAENIVRMDCSGHLPAGSALPRYPMKLSYAQTKIYCATWYGQNFLLSTAYGATVLPDGTAEISCVFKIH